MNVSLHHIAIISSDLEKAATMYGEILGLERDKRPDLNFDGLFYKLGDGQQLHVMKLDNPDANSDVPEHGGRYRHFALRCPDLSGVLLRLDVANITYTKSKSGRAAIFFYDDDKNAIELVQG